jgi:hypothetical protein
MTRLTTQVRQAASVLSGGADAAPGVPGPYLVLDLGRGLDPHQTRCRRCRWRSSWRATAVQAQAEHDRHQLAAHGRGRRTARHGRRRLVIRRRAR